MKINFVKCSVNWKIIYTAWIVYAWLIINKPLPNYHDKIFEKYELSWWIIGGIITMVAIHHLYKRNWMQATLLFLLFAVPKFLVYVGNTEVVSGLFFRLLKI